MRKTKKRNMAAGAAVFALAGGLAIAASPAQAAPVHAPRISCTLTQDAPGSFFRVVGNGFPPGELVVLLDSSGTMLGKDTARLPEGSFDFPYLPIDNYTVASGFGRVGCV